MPSLTARSTMISPASRSSVLRNSSPARSSGIPQPRRRAKHLRPREGRRFDAALEFFDVDPESRQGARHLAHDARPLVADEVQLDDPLALGRARCDAALDGHAKAARLEAAQGGGEVDDVRLGHADQQNAGEFAGQMGQSAFQPGPSGGGDGLRYRVHETGPVAADEGQHQRRPHVELLARFGAAARARLVTEYSGSSRRCRRGRRHGPRHRRRRWRSRRPSGRGR